MENHAPLKIDGLTKYYDRLLAVNGVSLELNPGEIFGLIGPNGAGKTTIISTITTLEEPTSGTVSVFGHNVTKEPQIAKYLTGCVPQELVNYGFFNIEEILGIISGYFGKTRNQKQIEYLIHKLGLEPHRKKLVKQLSGGLKRRLLIAKALVHKPRLLLLDEPTAGVDIELRSALWEFVRELREDGVSILLTTHYLEEAEELCDRIGVIDHGELKLTGKTEEIVKKYTIRIVTLHLKSAMEKIRHEQLFSQSDQELIFHLPSYMSIGELIANLPFPIQDMQDVTIREGTLEDAFQKIVGKDRNNGS